MEVNTFSPLPCSSWDRPRRAGWANAHTRPQSASASQTACYKWKKTGARAVPTSFDLWGRGSDVASILSRRRRPWAVAKTLCCDGGEKAASSSAFISLLTPRIILCPLCFGAPKAQRDQAREPRPKAPNMEEGDGVLCLRPRRDRLHPLWDTRRCDGLGLGVVRVMELTTGASYW